MLPTSGRPGLFLPICLEPLLRVTNAITNNRNKIPPKMEPSNIPLDELEDAVSLFLDSFSSSGCSFSSNVCKATNSSPERESLAYITLSTVPFPLLSI